MNDNEIDLGSVNWTKGMLLTPEHFLRQEKYFDSSLLWLMRYATNVYGLVGAGARGEVVERGAAKYDPIIHIDDNGEVINISVTQCRGISPSGDIIEIDPSHAIHKAFLKQEYEKQKDLGVYIVCVPHLKFDEDSAIDSANPQTKSSRHQKYFIKLEVNAAEASHSLMISRLQQLDNSVRFEKVPGFIPVCTSLIGHSELKRSWEKLQKQLESLADCYAQLHKAMVEYISMAGERGINTREDDESLLFVGRMVVSLEGSTYELFNPLQSPQQFFQQLYRVIRSAAVYLDLSPPTRDYFRYLAETGVSEFGSLLEQERNALLTNRELTIHDNLSLDVQRIEQSLLRLRRLEEALEGKYMDYRVSTALEALSFFFDRRSDPPALYQTIHRPSRPQYFDNELTFVFAPLRLEGRQSYRLVLARENEAHVEIGRSIEAEIRINVGAGQGFETLYKKAICDVPDQRNFAVDFETPANVPAIHDLRVIVNASTSIRSCLLYARRRVIQGRVIPKVVPPDFAQSSGSIKAAQPIPATDESTSKPDRRLSPSETKQDNHKDQNSAWEEPLRPGRLIRKEDLPEDPPGWEPPIKRRRLE